MWAFTAYFQPSLNSPIPFISISSRSSHSRVCPKPTLICSSLQSQVETLNGTTDGRISERNEIRFGLPSKGRMATDTLELLKVHYSASFLFCLLFFFFHFSSKRFQLFNFFFSGMPGLSIISKTSQSAAVCCKYPTSTC